MSVFELVSRGATLEERLRFQSDTTRSRKIDNRQARERLKVWRGWFSRNGSSGWSDFLAAHNLTEERLLALDGPVCTRPFWSKTLQRICAHLRRSKTKAGNLADEVAQFAWRELRESVPSGFLSPQAAASLQRSLVKRLKRTAKPTIVWERLASNADRKNSKSFSDDAVDLANYPALARLWAVQIESWLLFAREFLQRAAAFVRSDTVAGLMIDLSDSHEGNRSVIQTRFRKSGTWFYKPRPGDLEKAWHELLQWINAQGFSLPFRTVKLHAEERHHWMEEVRARPCCGKTEAEKFYFRLGGLLCLLDLLRGVDFHPGNFVFAGDQPVVIDCETLFHPKSFLPPEARDEEDLLRRTGVLLVLREISKGWAFQCRALTNGFREMHTLFSADQSRAGFLKQWMKKTRRSPIRLLYRPTTYYDAILEHSLAPSRMTNGLERSLYLEACCRDGVSPLRLAHHERKALEDADIPLFRGRSAPIDLDLSRERMKESISVIEKTLNGYQGCQVQR